MIWVVLKVDGAMVKECPVDRDLLIGRIPTSDLHVASTEVSSRHARLSPRGHGAVLTDLNSTNGTFVDGEKRVAAGVELAVEPGMRICIGPGILEFRKVDPPAPPPPKPKSVDAEEHFSGTMVIGTQDAQAGIVQEAKFRAARPRLVVSLENDRRIVPLESMTVEVGREGCPVSIGHPSVSGRHARVSFENGFFILQDLQSRNGTFVDGLPVTAPTPLGIQTAVTFGTVECLFVQEPPKQGEIAEVAAEVLAAHVVALGKATRHQADQVLQEHASSGKSLGEILVERGILPPREWSEIYAQRKLIGTLAPGAGTKPMHPLVWVAIGLGVAAIAGWGALRWLR